MVFIWVTFLWGKFRSVHGILIPQDISYSLSSDLDFILILDNWKLSFFIIEYFLYNTRNSTYNMENNV